MKIKTVVFWILWVGNSLTLQTVSGQDPDPASPPSFPIRLDVSIEQRTRLDALQTFQALEAADTKPL
jgi:hypothetical protein